jgi:hypothetical protein
MPYDYTQAPPQRGNELIPPGTVAAVALKIRAGGAGEDRLLKRSRNGGCEMLDLKFTVVDGQYARRKFWENLILTGSTDGHAQASEVSRAIICAIIESAKGIKPQDVSPQARQARTVELKDIDGMTFLASVEKGGPRNDGSGENYSDKNILAAVVTPDKKDWHPVEQRPPLDSGSGGSGGPTPPATTPIARPAWAS